MRIERKIILLFKNITIDDKEIIEKYTKQNNYFLCEHCFTDIFIWRYNYSTKYCIQDDFLFIKMKTHEDKKEMYLAPIGSGDLKKAIELIIEDSKQRNIPFIMISISEEIKIKIEEIMPEVFDFEENRDNADYIYLAEDLINLKGKKFHSKRNFINRFKQTYENRWIFEDITEDNAHEVFNYQLKWYEENRGIGDNNSLFSETSAIAQALKNFKALELKGGLLRLDGNIIAFTLASRSAYDMFTVQIEKAEHSINGAYQIINNEFAKKNFEGVKYVDREEDLGIEGLRKAKLSYNPVLMGVNYNAVLKKNDF